MVRKGSAVQIRMWAPDKPPLPNYAQMAAAAGGVCSFRSPVGLLHTFAGDYVGSRRLVWSVNVCRVGMSVAWVGSEAVKRT